MAVRTRAWLGASSRLAIRPKPQLSRSYELLQREGDGASIVRFPQASTETGEPLARTPGEVRGGRARRQILRRGRAAGAGRRDFRPRAVGRLSYTITMRSIIPASKALASTDDDPQDRAAAAAPLAGSRSRAIRSAGAPAAAPRPLPAEPSWRRQIILAKIANMTKQIAA